jgi:hypothetical protein
MTIAIVEAGKGRESSATRLVWWTLGFLLLAVVVGFGWDRAWHATHPFEDFWSPPHLFIYTTLAVAAGLLARLLRDPELAVCFGEPDVALFGHRVHPPLLLPAAGMAGVFCAGLLDSVWHTAFGLDETGWSMPHAMLGWGILVTLLGLITARIALTGSHPLGWASRGLLALLLMSAVTGIVLGPLGGNNSPQLVREIADLPVLASEPEAQHTFQIYLDWNITRTAGLFVPMAAFASGAALRLARYLIPDWPALIAVVGVATLLAISGDLRTARYFDIEGDARNWLPLPLLPATVTFLVGRMVRLSQAICWLLGGFMFGVVATSWWGAEGAWALLASPAMFLGAVVGGKVEQVIRAPTSRSVAVLGVLLGVAVPAGLGMVDLYLRAATP